MTRHKDVQMNLRFTEDTGALFQKIQGTYGLSRVGVVEQLLIEKGQAMGLKLPKDMGQTRGQRGLGKRSMAAPIAPKSAKAILSAPKVSTSNPKVASGSRKAPISLTAPVHRKVKAKKVEEQAKKVPPAAKVHLKESPVGPIDTTGLAEVIAAAVAQALAAKIA